MNRLEKIADFVNSLPYDIKAEVLIALLYKDTLERDETLASFNGQLKRKYSRDISMAEVREFDNGEKAIVFNLNRDGIYDALPEALFHSFSEEGLLRGEDMARDSVKVKNEEKETRSFFQAFEHQIFAQLVELAEKEDSLFNSIYSSTLQGLIPDFWNISSKIPEDYANRLIRLIPLAHKIVGDINLTAQALEFILREAVSMKIRYSLSFPGDGGSSGSSAVTAGDCRLGLDSFCGDRPEIPVRELEVNIGPLCKLDITHFINEGWLKTLLDSFFSFFLPMELIPRPDFLLGKGGEGFQPGLEEPGKIAYLGYNSVLD